MKKILIIGHSHVNALIVASKNYCKEYFEFYSIPRDGLEGVFKLIPLDYDSVFFLIEGNYHNIYSLVDLPIRFDFNLPDHLIKDSSSPCYDVLINHFNKSITVLPYGIVLSQLSEDLRFVFSLTEKLHKAFKLVNCYLMEPPPPVPASHVISFPHPFEEMIRVHGIARPEFRFKIYLTYLDAIRTNASRLNLRYIEVPIDAIAFSDGFLKDFYLHTDATHANEAYGKLVLNQILTLRGLIY